jgi:hypothetical protein
MKQDAPSSAAGDDPIRLIRIIGPAALLERAPRAALWIAF